MDSTAPDFDRRPALGRDAVYLQTALWRDENEVMELLLLFADIGKRFVVHHQRFV